MFCNWIRCSVDLNDGTGVETVSRLRPWVGGGGERELSLEPRLFVSALLNGISVNIGIEGGMQWRIQ